MPQQETCLEALPCSPAEGPADCTKTDLVCGMLLLGELGLEIQTETEWYGSEAGDTSPTLSACHAAPKQETH